MARVLVVSDVEPRPAVERALPHPGDVVRHQIVPHAITLVGRAIEIPGHWMDCETDAVSDSGCEHASVLAVRIEFQHIGAAGFAAPGRAKRLLGDPRLQSFRRASHSLPGIAGRPN